jgi:hypothetical protein
MGKLDASSASRTSEFVPTLCHARTAMWHSEIVSFDLRRDNLRDRAELFGD